MLYLEDYLEMIEHLPQELRDRFTDMREMDLGVQNSLDGLEKKVKVFFGNAKRLPKVERDAEHDAIRKEYYKTLEDADEKVQLASQMYELVDRYLRRLDSELFKFKIELEADNAGITEILEKRSLELDAPPPSSREKENRYTFGSRPASTHGKQKKRRDSSVVSGLGGGGSEKRHSSDGRSGHSAHGSGHGMGHGHNSHGLSHGVGHGHGGHRDHHGSHGHRDHRDHHGHRDGHGGHRDRDSHLAQSHAAYRDSHGVIHRDGHSTHNSGHRDNQGHVLSYGLAPNIGLKDRDRERDREGRSLFGQSHHQLQASSGLGGLAMDSTPSRGVPGQAQLQSHSMGYATSNVSSPSPAASSASSSASSHRDSHRESHRDAHRDRDRDRDRDSHNVGYSLGHIGAGGNAIAAAASQAIAATQQMQQGRRTASLKASYEALNIGGSHSHDFAIGREIAGAAQTALAAIHDIPKKKKKSSSSSSSHQLTSVSSGLGSSLSSNSQLSASNSLAAESLPMANDSAEEGLLDPNGDGLGDGENPDWTYDPNEPRYCLCNQVSYGDMVACDNEDCPFEWFHYACVSITAPPKGKWYCPQCSSSMKRRRKN